ncbi:hypothetical protein HNY73_015565 [Argiope bruennichi]|uniref:Uncharacterized protein n=1 Tax=Argiope bruennichi TaxID=94029 RepID=A0A8T0ESF5_ARGBR|nr:hypothetical protein HNY73_015565 [Argiope bruennichi]
MDEFSVDRTSTIPMEMLAHNPVERNDIQDGPISERASSKPTASSKAAAAQKVRGHKGLRESSKSVKMASNSLAIKRPIGRHSKSSVGAKKVARPKAKGVKSPVKKKAAASKDKKPKKSPKRAGLKKPNAKPSTRGIKN